MEKTSEKIPSSVFRFLIALFAVIFSILAGRTLWELRTIGNTIDLPWNMIQPAGIHAGTNPFDIGRLAGEAAGILSPGGSAAVLLTTKKSRLLWRLFLICKRGFF